MKKILFITGKSQYDSTKLFMEEMAASLSHKNVQVDTLTAYDEQDFAAKRRVLSSRHYDAIFTINGMALEPDSSLGNILLQGDTLYCTMLMDHPYIHHERLQNSYGNIFVMSPDMEHTDYLEKYYPNIRYAAFLPHGGCCAEGPRPYSEREIAISFMGSYNPPEQMMEQMLAYPSQMSDLLVETALFIVRYPQYSVSQAIYFLLEQKGMVDEHTNLASICPEFRIVDTYIRHYFRDKVIRTIAEAGIPVDVYGDGWELMCLSEHARLNLHPRVDYKKSLEIIENTKISLNVMPWFKAGSHDRIFTAMLCGSLCLTDSSSYLEQVCTPGENILFYSLDDLVSLPEIILQALADEDSSSKIAKNGQLLAKKHHTWEVRAEQFLEYLKQIEKR